MKISLGRLRRFFRREASLAIGPRASSPIAETSADSQAAAPAFGPAPPDAHPGFDPTLVSSLQEGLRHLNAGAAEVFLALGGALQSIVREAREVAALSKAAAELGTETGSSQSLATLQGMLEDAGLEQAKLRSSSMKLHDVLSRLEACRAPMSRLTRLPVALNWVGMLSRIESSRLANATVNVSSLTADIDDMTGRIQKHVATVGEGSARLGQQIQQTTAQLDEIEQRTKVQAAQLIRQTGEVLASFRTRQEATNRAVLKIDQQYGEARHAADKIVMSLQSEDIARQRIEHVQEALGQLDGGAACAALDSGQASVLVLQHSQLLSTRDLLSKSIASIHHDLQSLAPVLAALTADTSSLASQTGDDGHTFSATIKSKLEALCSIFGQYFDSARSAEATIHSVMPALAEMAHAVSLVEEIQASIRLMALNAEIKTARLGDHGAALGVLAAELHEMTGQSDGDIRAVLESLHGAQSLFDTMTEQGTPSSPSGRSRCDRQEMKKEMDRLVDSVVAAGEALPKKLAELSARAASLRSDLETAAGIAERGREVIQIFDGLLEKLDRDLRRLGCSRDSLLPHHGTTANLSTLYSMESERHVHRHVIRGTAPDELPGIPQPHEDLGGDVELF